MTIFSENKMFLLLIVLFMVKIIFLFSCRKVPEKNFRTGFIIITNGTFVFKME